MRSTIKINWCFFSIIIFVTASLNSCSQWANTSAPDALFTTITGKKIDLKQLAGKPVLITFWATSCPSCIKEIPHWLELHQHYHSDGLEIIAIAMFYDIPSRVIAMSQAKQLTYNIVLDVQAIHAQQFGNVQFTPSTFLIAPDQKIVWSTVGGFDINDMNKRIENLLKG